MTNPMRGELEVNLAGQTYKTRLTIDGMMRLESQIGKGVIRFAQDLSQADASVSDVIKTLTIAIRGGGNKIDDTEVKKLVMQHGLASSLAVVGEILTNALVGGQTEGNAEAAEES